MVVRSPPYEFQYKWSRMEDMFISVDTAPIPLETGFTGLWVSRQNGHAEFYIRGSTTAETVRGVGIFFRPPSQNGILTISSTPGFFSYYLNRGTFAGVETKAWIGIFIDRFFASNNTPDAPIVRQQVMVFDRDIAWWLGSEERRDSNTGFPLNAQIRVDSSHWYTIWVMCGGLVRATRGWSVGISAVSINVPSIIWSYAAIV
jgi:hypothetical protein